MRRRIAGRWLAGLVLLVLAIAVGLAAAPLPRARPTFTQPEWIGPVHIVDVAAGTILPGKALRVVGGRIEQVVDLHRVPANARTKLLDVGGAFVTPGLWDMHAVLTRYADALEHPLYLAHGVTRLRSILNCPSEGKPSLYACQSDKRRWNGEIRAGRMVGAVTMSSGSYPVGGAAALHPDAPSLYAATTPGEARELVRLVARQRDRPDHIKTYDGLPRPAFFALIAEAKVRDIEVSGHVPVAVKVAEASAAGLKAIAHARSLPVGCSSREDEIIRLRASKRRATEWMRLALATQDPGTCQALWETLRSNRTFVSPTLITRFSETKAGIAELRRAEDRDRFSPQLYRWIWSEDVAPIEARSPGDEEVYRSFYRAAARRVAEAEQAGVRLLIGSDTGDAFVAAGLGVHQEMALWRRAGIPVPAILRAATLNAAEYHGQSDQLGRIAPGYGADMVFTERNPLADLSTLRTPIGVLQEGRYHDRRALAAARAAAVETASSWRFPFHMLRDLLRNPRGFVGS